MRFLSKYLPQHFLNEKYKLYIRPLLDHGDIIYDIPRNICEFSHSVVLNNTLEKPEHVRYSAVLAVKVLGTSGTSLEKLYGEFGWESLDLRQWSRRRFRFYRIFNHFLL